MTTTGCLGALAVAAAVAGCVKDATPVERALCAGENAAVSPDGSRVAFQRLENDVFKIGIYDLASGNVSWVEDGPGNAAYPAWTPTGGLVYMYGNDVKTAYQAGQEGFGKTYYLRLWENGVKKDLTGDLATGEKPVLKGSASNRCRDYTPTVSPDGKTVYFTSTRWIRQTSRAYSTASTSMIGSVGIGGGEPVLVVDSPNGYNSGVVQPAVSPDGKFLVWGHLQSFFGYWRIFGAKLSDTSRSACCPITPKGLVATAPRWHPNGKVICFSGFLKGDPDWGVWVEDVTTGGLRRLCSGQNPSFSPDGKSLVYDLGKQVRIRPYGAADAPTLTLSTDEDWTREEERVLSRRKEPLTKRKAFPAPEKTFAFDQRTFFVRAKVKVDGAKGLRQFVIGDYKESHLGFQLYYDTEGQNVWFSSRTPADAFRGVKMPCKLTPGEHELTGIRTKDGLYVSVDGALPAFVQEGTQVSLKQPQQIIYGTGLHDGEAVLSAEIGTGWPKNVPHAPTREDLFK